ncbi:MAG: M24 family metallopeptidase [Acidobacteria bacterium]|nr:M24 family metallopeptidase [Acidobacteriota bacterium]
MKIDAIQQALREHGIDAWLFYDFHRRDPIAYRVLRLKHHGMATRRWYYLLSATGQPVKLVHRIESGQLDSLSGDKRVYASWQEHQRLLQEILKPYHTVAMQYSPLNQIPYISSVDAGTVDLIRSFGKNVVSSAALVQQFECRWSDAALASHLEAGKLIDGIIEETFREIGRRVEANGETDEYSVQQFILEQFELHKLTSSRQRPIVAVNANSGNPHYEPLRDRSAPIRPGDFVLLDVWGKLNRPGAVYYDVTWTGIVAAEPPENVQRIFEIVKAARNQAVETVQSAVRAGRPLHGWEVDRAARNVITESGYGEYFVHRTGHSIGEEVHGNGANMDDWETHDDRPVIPQTCFSVEPGIYLPEFGVRSEVNVYVSEHDARVTGRVQDQLIRIQAAPVNSYYH